VTSSPTFAPSNTSSEKRKDVTARGREKMMCIKNKNYNKCWNIP